MRSAAALAERLGLPVKDFDLLEQALIHTSWLHEHPEAARGHNERLEFLGDAVVNLAVSEALYARRPLDDEGLLSGRRASIVSTVGLARLATRLDLGGWLRLGQGEDQRGGRRRPLLLASAFEALVGALYLDLGYGPTRDWLLRLAADALDLAAGPLGSLKNPKNRLQESTQRRSGSRPVYRVVEAAGPDHAKLFRVSVEVDGVVVGHGDGPSRRIAEAAAAAEAIERIRTLGDDAFEVAPVTAEVAGDAREVPPDATADGGEPA